MMIFGSAIVTTYSGSSIAPAHKYGGMSGGSASAEVSVNF